MRVAPAPAAAAALLACLGGPGAAAQEAPVQEATAPDAPAGGGALEELDRAARAVVERCAPAVVRVEAERRLRLRVVAEGEDERRQLEEALRRTPPSESVSAAGFLLDESGLVLTTSAVAGDASAVRVIFAGGPEREGEVLGEDGLAGVALVRIAPVEGVRALRFSAREPRPGTLSLSLAPQGSGAAGLQFGFVTAPRRAFGLHDGWLVSSVPVEPGQAGAPLLDAAGEVLGMAVAPRISLTVRSPGPGAPVPPVDSASAGAGGTLGWMIENSRTVERGPGFSTFVPAADLRRIAADLLALGRVRRGLLGVKMLRGEPVVREVPGGFPAAGAGIVPGDRVLSVDGSPVASAEEVTGFIQRRAPGTPVRVRLRSPGGPEREVSVVLAEAPRPSAARALFNGLGVAGREDYDLSAAKFQTLQVEGGRFVVVESVATGSAAERAGILPGDWIVEIRGRPVLSEKEFAEAATGTAAAEDTVDVLIYRAGEEQRRRVVLK